MSITRSNVLGTSASRSRRQKAHAKTYSQPSKISGNSNKPVINNIIGQINGVASLPDSPTHPPERKKRSKSPNNVRFSSTPHVASTLNGKSHKKSRVAIKFKIGMQVGLGLGECFLQLQKLENTVSKLTEVSQDVKGVLQDLSAVPDTLPSTAFPMRSQSEREDIITDMEEALAAKPQSTRASKGARGRKRTQTVDTVIKQRSKSRHITKRQKGKGKNSSKKNGSSGAQTPTPRDGAQSDKEGTPPEGMPDSNPSLTMKSSQNMEDCMYITELLDKWQREAGKKMKSLAQALGNLQHSLEDLDDANEDMINKQHSSSSSLAERTELEDAYRKIGELQSQLSGTRQSLKEKDSKISKIKKTYGEKEKRLQDIENELVQREEQLDSDAEAIVAQTEALRAESQKLMEERNEIRRQKEHWQKLVEEQSSKNLEVKKRAEQVEGNHQKLLALHQTIVDEKKKLHKEKKRLIKKEKKLAKEKTKFGGHPSETRKLGGYGGYDNQSRRGYAHSSGRSEYDGSEYAESEYADTIISDGATEIASVNSISDDEREEINIRRQQIQHLEIPLNPYQ